MLYNIGLLCYINVCYVAKGKALYSKGGIMIYHAIMIALVAHPNLPDACYVQAASGPAPPALRLGRCLSLDGGSEGLWYIPYCIPMLYSYMHCGIMIYPAI